MANTKISELENKSTLEDSDLIPIVDMSDEDNPATKNVKAGLINQSLSEATQILTATTTIASGTTITNGYEVTLPLSYQVGNNSLQLILDGEVLVLATDTTDGHYTEVGTEGELSNTIAFYRTDDDGDYTLDEDLVLVCVVKGVSQE